MALFSHFKEVHIDRFPFPIAKEAVCQRTYWRIMVACDLGMKV